MSTGHILLALFLGFMGGCAFMYILRPYDNKSCYELAKKHEKECKK